MSPDEMFIRFLLWGIFAFFFYYTLFWFLGLFIETEKKITKNTKTSGVTVAVPVFNEESTIAGTIESLYEMNYPKDKLHVVVVNDGSTDKTEEICLALRKKYPFRYLYQSNKGKYTALNRALKTCEDPYFACLDADSFVEKDSLTELLHEFEDDEVAASMPIMKVLNPKNWILRLQSLEYITSIFLKALMELRDCIHVTPGPFTVYRTDVLKSVSGFAKAHHTEDLEMALRLQEKHYKMKQSMSAVIYTNSPQNWKAYYKQRMRWYKGTFLNVFDYRRLFFKKKYGDFGTVQLPMIFLGGGLTLIAVFAIGYTQIKIAWHYFHILWLSNFDLMTYLRTIQFDFNFLKADFFVFFTTICLFLLMVLVLHASLITNGERFGKRMAVTALLYFFIYPTITAYIWLCAFTDIIFKKTDAWLK